MEPFWCGLVSAILLSLPFLFLAFAEWTGGFFFRRKKFEGKWVTERTTGKRGLCTEETSYGYIDVKFPGEWSHPFRATQFILAEDQSDQKGGSP